MDMDYYRYKILWIWIIIDIKYYLDCQVFTYF